MVNVVLYSVLGVGLAPSRHRWPCCWSCARCSASRWAANGASAPRWRWRRSRRRSRGFVSGMLQRAIRAAICWRRWSTAAVRSHRLARHVHGRRAAGAAGAVSCAARCRNRRCSSGAREAAARARLLDHDARRTGSLFALRRRADGRLQLLQPRHAGPLSDFPADAAAFRHAHRSAMHRHRATISARILGGTHLRRLSERIGRRRAIVIAALLALPMIPLWALRQLGVLLASARS